MPTPAIVDEAPDFRGKLIDSYGLIRVWSSFPHPFYEITNPPLNDKERALAENLVNVLARKANVSDVQKALGNSVGAGFTEKLRQNVVNYIEAQELVDKLPTAQQWANCRQLLIDFLAQNAPFVSDMQILTDYVLHQSIGYGSLGLMMMDEYLEEIMVNGEDKRVFVFHKKYGMCKSNVNSEQHENLLVLINRMARSVGRRFDAQNPLLDARLPDGSRANATYSYVTPFGITLTIRKFSQIPLSVMDLIKNKTLSTEVAAFLWVMMEGMGIEPMNMIVAGGTSSGKTTTLNALGSFIPISERMISIEDTLELDFGDRDNWIQMEARLKTRDMADVSMDDLLRNSLRMRPDRIVVGEVRGSEAKTMFVAMDTGHRGLIGTLHANNAKETLIRLKNEPMAVPEAMLPLLDLIVVQYRQYQKNVGIIRRVMQVSELSRMNEQVLLSDVFEWDREKDVLKRTDVPSRVLEVLAERSGNTKKELMREMAVRQRILDWMVQKKITSKSDVDKIIQAYYYNPKTVLEKVSEDL